MTEEKMRHMELILDFEDAVRREEREDYSPPGESPATQAARQALLAALSTKQEAGEEDDDGQPTQSIKDGAQQLRDLYQNTTPLKAGEVSRSQTVQALEMREQAAKVAEDVKNNGPVVTSTCWHAVASQLDHAAKRIRALSLPAPDET